MKTAKAGPNLVMPDKTRYSRIQAVQISTHGQTFERERVWMKRKPTSKGTVAIAGRELQRSRGLNENN